MKTVIQIYQAKDGHIGARNMTSHLDQPELLKCVGMMEVIKKHLLDLFEYEDMEMDEVDKIRGLIDET